MPGQTRPSSRGTSHPVQTQSGETEGGETEGGETEGGETEGGETEGGETEGGETESGESQIGQGLLSCTYILFRDTSVEWTIDTSLHTHTLIN